MLCLILIIGGLLIMMGQHDRSEALFYYFRLEDQVPETHLLRLIEKHISFAFVRERLKQSYSETGRPSIGVVREKSSRWRSDVFSPLGFRRTLPQKPRSPGRLPRYARQLSTFALYSPSITDVSGREAGSGVRLFHAALR